MKRESIISPVLQDDLHFAILKQEKTRTGETDDGKKRGVSIDMNRQTKQQATLQQLRSLANQPNEQARYALEVLERERGKQVASEALAALTNSPVPQGRPLL